MSKKMASILFFLSLTLLVVGAAFAPTIFAEGGGEDLVDPAPPPPEMPPNPYGVWLAPTQEGAHALREANALWTTLFLNWNHVEKSPGEYDWSEWDEVLGKAAQEGYQVVATINGNPSWAADTSCGPIREDRLDDFATFIRKAVERYSYPPYNVLYWSFYNEPDNSDMVNYGGILGGCWGYAWNPNAAPGAGGDAYANMLKHVHPAVKAANPKAYVVMGGLAYDYFTTDPGGGLFDPYFLTDILEAGGGDYFDVLNFHYYPWSADIHWEPVGANRYQRHLAFKARWIATEVYNAIGERKPIMITEVGETSHNKDNAPDYHRQIWTLFETFMHGRMVNAYPILWFTGIDLEFSINYDGRRYGVLHLDGSPKPTYYAYKTLVQELQYATFVRPRDDLSSRFEGYVFNDRGRTKQVIWMYPGHPDFPPPQPLDLPVSQNGGSMRVVRVRSHPAGDNDLNIVSETIITDGGQGDHDGWVDGKIQVMIDEDYQFFEDLSQPMYTPTPTPTATPIPHIDLFLPVVYH
ncbi:MAG TPA: hypothetical protein EYP25_14335 [Anaerolineae bacterium]|nr:cellulase family glycosylhydrolase [Caldilineae bacterium]HID35718.1 hypothetical protein [Anaerolineae bacterium]